MCAESLAKRPNTGLSSERIGYIDSLKGFTILSVVLYHVVGSYLAAGMYSDHPGLQVLYSTIATFHMTTFMLISGYVFYAAYFGARGQPKRERIRRQVWNMVILYTVYDIAFGLLKIVCNRFTNNDASWSDIALFFMRPIAPYWYIYILIPLYIIFSLSCVHRHGKLTLCVTLAACVASTFLVEIDFTPPLNTFFYYAFFFWSGICYRKGTAPLFGRKSVTVTLFAAALTLHILRYSSDALQTIPGMQVLISLGISQGLWYAFEHVSFLNSNRFLSFFGRHSLEIYLLHGLFASAARTVFPSFILENCTLSIVLGFVFSTLIPVLFLLLCEKLSIHDAFFKPVAVLERMKKA